MTQCHVSLSDYLTYWKGEALAAVQPYRTIYVGPNRRTQGDRRLGGELDRRDCREGSRRYRLADRRKGRKEQD